MKKLICHGDSLTEGADLLVQYTWPAMLGSRLPLEIINAGIGGDTSGGLLGRFCPDVVQRHPDFVIILCGTNDLWWGVDTQTILSNIFAMACQANYHKITPIVGAPPPFFMEGVLKAEISQPFGGFKKCGACLADLASGISSSAQNSDVPFIDFYNAFLTDEGKTKGELFLEDGLHPNRQGHRVMAEKVVEVMTSIFFF